jgi:signal recognition particle GTPase
VLSLFFFFLKVLYRALDYAAATEADVLIVDTSGRLANNVALNAELVKMRKVSGRRPSTSPSGR